MRSSISVWAYFPLTSLTPLDVYKFELLRQPLSMEVLRLTTLTYNEKMLAELGAGSPIRMRWGRGRKTQEFHGYIHSLRPIAEETARRIEIVAMGPPMAMLTKSNRVCPQTTASHVAARLLDDYRLTGVVVPTMEILDFEQGDRTDWEFLLDLARKNEYVVTQTGVVVDFQPLRQMWMRRTRRQIPASTFGGAITPGGNLVTFEQDLSNAYPAYEYGVDTSMGFLSFARSDTDESLPTDTAFREMFPTHAVGTMLGLHMTKPMDVFVISHDKDELTWTALKIRYEYSPDGYRTIIDFGGNGTRIKPKISGKALDIPEEMKAQQARHTRTARPALANIRPIYTGKTKNPDTVPARWVAPVVAPPTTRSDLWKSA